MSGDKDANDEDEDGDGCDKDSDGGSVFHGGLKSSMSFAAFGGGGAGGLGGLQAPSTDAIGISHGKRQSMLVLSGMVKKPVIGGATSDEKPPSKERELKRRDSTQSIATTARRGSVKRRDSTVSVAEQTARDSIINSVAQSLTKRASRSFSHADSTFLKDDYFEDLDEDDEKKEDVENAGDPVDSETRALAQNRESITSAICVPLGGRPDDALDPLEEREKFEKEREREEQERARTTTATALALRDGLDEVNEGEFDEFEEEPEEQEIRRGCVMYLNDDMLRYLRDKKDYTVYTRHRQVQERRTRKRTVRNKVYGVA